MIFVISMKKRRKLVLKRLRRVAFVGWNVADNIKSNISIIIKQPNLVYARSVLIVDYGHVVEYEHVVEYYHVVEPHVVEYEHHLSSGLASFYASCCCCCAACRLLLLNMLSKTNM